MLIMAVGSGLIHEGIDKSRDFLSSESVLLNGLVQQNQARNFMLCSTVGNCWDFGRMNPTVKLYLCIICLVSNR